ncbi:MAG TPA: glycosyltransferase family 2 protein [Thermoanaerobaculia bacterium]|nr:glycosyltransferase family 2 protein [Thermoanaerobaculia bacterium]
MISWILAAAVVLSAVLLLCLLVNLAVIPRLSGSRPPATRFGRVSLVVPGRNEEREVGHAVASLLAQDYPDFEVIFVNDRSTDRTSEILAALPDPRGRLRVLDGADPPPGWLGKPHALWQGARLATGDLLLFVDADVHYHPSTVSEAVSALENFGADLLCILPRFEAEGFWENVLMPNVPASFFLGLGFLANWDRPRWLAAGGGAGNLIQRRVYNALGGHEALKDSVVDDVRLAFASKRRGFRTRVVRAENRASVRMYRGFREVWDGFTKNTSYIFQGAVGVLLLFLAYLLVFLAVGPFLVLLAALAGAPFHPADIRLAGAATGILILARLVLAASLGDPLWPALTHPFMSAVWAGIIGRSFFYRIVRRRLSWRGRDFDARGARF